MQAVFNLSEELGLLLSRVTWEVRGLGVPLVLASTESRTATEHVAQPHPVEFLIPPRKEIPQPLWATSSC